MASGKNRYWFKLDNAGKIYPAVRSPNFASLFRATARLREPVDPQTLQQALLDVMPRFPIFQVPHPARRFLVLYGDQSPHAQGAPRNYLPLPAHAV